MARIIDEARERAQRVNQAILENLAVGAQNTTQLVAATGFSKDSVWRGLRRLSDTGQVLHDHGLYRLTLRADDQAQVTKVSPAPPSEEKSRADKELDVLLAQARAVCFRLDRPFAQRLQERLDWADEPFDYRLWMWAKNAARLMDEREKAVNQFMASCEAESALRAVEHDELLAEIARLKAEEQRIRARVEVLAGDLGQQEREAAEKGRRLLVQIQTCLMNGNEVGVYAALNAAGVPLKEGHGWIRAAAADIPPNFFEAKRAASEATIAKIQQAREQKEAQERQLALLAGLTQSMALTAGGHSANKEAPPAPEEPQARPQPPATDNPVVTDLDYNPGKDLLRLLEKEYKKKNDARPKEQLALQ